MDQKVNVIFGSSINDQKEITKRIDTINNIVADMAAKYVIEKANNDHNIKEG